MPIRLKTPQDVTRYLRQCDWESDDLGAAVRVWRHPQHSGKHWLPTYEALALQLLAAYRALEAENHKLREKWRELKAKKG